MKKSKNTTKKRRAFTGIIYPDSAPDDFLDRIEKTHLDAILSPLHDKDMNPDNTYKKPHYHLMLMWNNPTTENNAKTVLTGVGCIDHIEGVESMVGMARYMCHMDNPEKHQYDRNDIKTWGDVDYINMIRKETVNKSIERDMFNYINDKNVYYFNDLVDHALEYEPEWYSLIKSNYRFYQSYISSLVKKDTSYYRFKNDENEKNIEKNVGTFLIDKHKELIKLKTELEKENKTLKQKNKSFSKIIEDLKKKNENLSKTNDELLNKKD